VGGVDGTIAWDAAVLAADGPLAGAVIAYAAERRGVPSPAPALRQSFLQGSVKG
jgi:hypothetical protein